MISMEALRPIHAHRRPNAAAQQARRGRSPAGSVVTSAVARPSGTLHVHVTWPSAYSPANEVTCGGAAPRGFSAFVDALPSGPLQQAMREGSFALRIPPASPAPITAANRAIPPRRFRLKRQDRRPYDGPRPSAFRRANGPSTNQPRPRRRRNPPHPKRNNRMMSARVSLGSMVGHHAGGRSPQNRPRLERFS